MHGTNEKWKPVVGWPMYAVSNQGRIKRLAGRDAADRYEIKEFVLKPTPVKSGSKDSYRPLYVTLSNGGAPVKLKVATLVLLAFRGPPPSKKKNCTRHLDDNQEHNQLKNLCWGSHRDNAEDRINNGKTSRGSLNGNSRITEAQAHSIIYELSSTALKWGTYRRISHKLRVPYSCVWNISKGLTWKHLKGSSTCTG